MSIQSEALQLASELEAISSDPWAKYWERCLKAATELRRLHEIEKQRDELLAALKYALENGCATVYAHEYDECGAKGCCGVSSYDTHADDCWVTKASAAIAKAED